MRITTILAVLTIFLAPGVVNAEETSESPQFRYRAHRTRAITRPSHRSIENASRNYRSNQATIRRNFARQLRKIEAERDKIAPEYSADPAPELVNDVQGHVPYFWYRTRRHVRHLHWVNEFRKEREVRLGEGPDSSKEDEVIQEEVEEETEE